MRLLAILNRILKPFRLYIRLCRRVAQQPYSMEYDFKVTKYNKRRYAERTWEYA